MDEQKPTNTGLQIDVPETDLKLSDGNISSDIKLNSGTNNDIVEDNDIINMDNLSLSNPTKYLATYKTPHEWILDQREAEAMQVLRDTMMPEQTTKVGTIAYSAGEFMRKTANMGRDFGEFAAGVDAYILPNANKEVAQRAYKDMKKLSVQAEQNRAEYVAMHGVDPDVYGFATNIMEVARDMVATGGVAALAKRGATKAAYNTAMRMVADSEVAARFASVKGLQAGSRAAKGMIAGTTFVRESGDRATQQAAEYMDKTGDYDLKYYDPTLDLALNTGVSAINSAIEMSLGIERAVPDMLFGTRRIGRVAEEFVRGYISERGEEFLQNMFDQGSDVVSGYRDSISITDAWKDSASAGWIGGIFGSGVSAGMYWLNRRRMIRQLEETGIDKESATEFVDKFLQNGVNKTLSNMSSMTELRTKEGPAYDKLKAGIKNALVLQGWNTKMIDPATGNPMNIDEYVETLVNNDLVNRAISEAMGSGITMDEWLDVANFTVVDNVLYPRSLGTVSEIQERIAEQDAIIKRQTELKKTGAQDDTVLQDAKLHKAILEKLKTNKLLTDEIDRVSVEQAKTPEIMREIDTATTDATELAKADSASGFVGGLEGTDEQKAKRLGNAVMKRIFGRDKRGFDKIMTMPEYANVRAAITSVADKIFDYAKKHRTYGIYKDLYGALKQLPSVTPGNFIDTVNTPDLTGNDPIAQNAFLYNFVFNDANTAAAFIDAYLTRAEQSVTNQTKTSLSKKDLVGQAFKATDALMQTQADAAGLQYTSIYNEDGSVADPNVVAVFTSYQNQFVADPKRPRLPKQILEQFDLADENARLDEQYPEYTGDTIVVDGITRPVYNSEGKRINKSAEALTNFWRWFEDSKAVDKNGRPLVLYHGARGKTDITEFRPKEYGYNVEATYFATNSNAAGHWAQSYVAKRNIDENFMKRVDETNSLEELLDIYNSFGRTVKIVDYDGFYRLDEEYQSGATTSSPLGKKITDTTFNMNGKTIDVMEMLRRQIKRIAEQSQVSDLYSVYAKLENPLIVDAKKQPYHSIEFNGEKTTTATIAQFALNNNYDGVIIKNVYETDYENVLTDDVLAFEPTQIKSVENLGYYSPTDSRMLYQPVYVSLKGDLEGDYIDADQYLGRGDDTRVWLFGNYSLLSQDIDKEHYFDRFEKAGPAIRYDGKELKDLYEETGINSPTVQSIIENHVRDIKSTKEQTLDRLDSVIKEQEEIYKQRTEGTIRRFAKKLGGRKIVRQMIKDINDIITSQDGQYQILVASRFPKDSKLYEIQKKYRNEDDSLSEDFVDLYTSLVEDFEPFDGMYAQDNAYIGRVLEIYNMKKSTEAFKKLDWDKFTGRLGFLYKGEHFQNVFWPFVRDTRYYEYARSDITMRTEKVLKKALKTGQDVQEALNSLDSRNEYELNLIPKINEEISKRVDEYKDRYPDADTEAVKKILNKYMTTPQMEIKGFAPSIIWEDEWDDFNNATKDLLNAVQGSYIDLSMDKENPQASTRIGELVDNARMATTRQAVLNAVKGFFKDATNADFVYKSRATMIEGEAPEDNELLNASRSLDRQPKEVQNALIEAIRYYMKKYPNMHLDDWITTRIRQDEFDTNPEIVGRIFGVDPEVMHAFIIDQTEKNFPDIRYPDVDRLIAKVMWQSFENALLKNENPTIADLKKEVLNQENKYLEHGTYDYYPKDRFIATETTRYLTDALNKKKAKESLIPYAKEFPEFKGVQLLHVNAFQFLKSVDRTVWLNRIEYKLDQDKTLGLRKTPATDEILVKMLRKFGIKGLKYYGNRDKRGIVTWQKLPVNRVLYSLDFQNEPKLVATHAVSKTGIEQALEVGGFAMPSLAITKDIDENSYGDILFVAPASMAQPSRNTRVYDRDAWTPMIDFIEYSAKEGFADRVKDILGPDVKDWSMYVANIEKEVGSWPENNIMAKQLFGIYKGIEEPQFIQRKFEEDADLRNEYLKWYYEFIMPNMQGRIFRGYTPSGTPRYAKVNLDNIVRELKTQPEHRDFSYYDFYGFHDVARELVRRFKTPQDIKKEQDRIQDAVAVQNQESELQSEFYILSSDLIIDKNDHNSQYALANALVDNEGTLPERLQKYGLKNDMKSVKAVEGIIEKIKQVPVRYFEVKPQRAVRFNEFSAVFVPKKESYDEIAERLTEQGANVLRYGSKEERAAMFDELVNGDETVLFQGRRAKINGMYDPELSTILIGKNFNGTTLPHEFAHYWLDTIFKVFKRVQAGELKANPEWVAQKREMFAMLGINENQPTLTKGQQEKFATMLEAYISGVGVSNEIPRTFMDYMKWVPEKYRSLQQLSYIDEKGNMQNVFLDAQAVDFFNRWYQNYSLPSLSTSPERQRFMNVTGDDGQVIRVSIKEVNDREKEFAQDAEEQLHTDQRLYNTLDENMPEDIKPTADAQKVVIAERGNFLKASEEEQKKIITPEDHKRRWFERKSRETEAQLAQEYIEKNPDHARDVIFGDPELIPNDTGVDRATLINTYMALNNISPDKPEWAQLHTNIAINQSLAGTELALSNDKSYRTYLDALREIEETLEMKAATNYAGSKVGALERFNADIQKFLDKELPAIFATEPDSKEREMALKAMFEKARTTFSGNTTGSFLTQMDFDYAKAQKAKTDAFVKWAIKQIKKDAGAKLNNEQQAHLLQISAKAQQALVDLDNPDAAKAVAGAQELRKWQLEKQKLMGVSPKKFSLFGDYAPRAMLASINTLVVANLPSTAINTLVTNLAKDGDLFGKNNVSENLIEKEIKRIKKIYGATSMNLAQMEKPTSPSLLHGEKYSASGQKWYDPYTILGREDNFFRVPTFVWTLARIASTDAKASGRSADEVFLEYIKLSDQSDAGKLARKQALAVANMAVFTQNGALARCLNHIRSELNYLSRVPFGLDPKGFGLGSLIAPFLTTGANIAEMGIRGAIAPITTTTNVLQSLRTRKPLDQMQKLALRMDWTYFVLSAVSMALLAALTSDDDDFYIDPYRTGRSYDPNKPYDSINIGGVWVDLDTFGPFAIPMRTAAKVIQAWKEDNGIGTAIGKGYAESAKSVIGDIPLAESIVNNQFNWATKQPGAFASSYAYNQANKLVPAFVKPVSRALSRGQGWEFDDGFMGQTIGRKFHRNYGFDGQELTSQDLLEMLTIKFQLGQDAQDYIDGILGLQ